MKKLILTLLILASPAVAQQRIKTTSIDASTATTGQVIRANSGVAQWATIPSGSVTSVAATGASPITVSGSPITTSGTLTIGLSTSGISAGACGTSSAYAIPTFDTFGRATSCTTQALGTAAFVNTGTSGGTVPLLNANNNFSGNTLFSSGQITNGSASTVNPTFYINGVAGSTRGLNYSSSSSIRWFLYTNATAESGSNAGSDFIIGAYDDSGAMIDTPLTIVRASGGNITLSRTLVLPAIRGPNNSGLSNGGDLFAIRSGGTQGVVFLGNTNNHYVYFDGNAYEMPAAPLVISSGYTVATLPACNGSYNGARAFVTNALAPVFLVAVVGGGTVDTPVFCNGANWVAG